MVAGVADTHTIMWYMYADPRLSVAAKAFVEGAAASGDQIGRLHACRLSTNGRSYLPVATCYVLVHGVRRVGHVPPLLS